MAQVELNQIAKVYPGGVRAVNSIDLFIKDQEFIVLVGPSGCGKSTTLRMIAGLEEISEGTLKIGDKVVNDVPPKDRDIAMVFQNYALYPHMTVYNNMAFGLKLRKFPKAEIDKRVKDAAQILDIMHLLDRKPKALSGGQRQRVAVGRAIVREPAAFLFDEPLSNLDAKLRVTTRAEIKRLHQRLRTTTIYVTHDQEEAMTLGDRIIVMKDGLIQQADSPLQTYRMPLNRFVAGFIGMPPMNFFDGSIKNDGGTLIFEEGSLKGAKAVEQRSDEPTVMAGELTLPGNGFRLPVPAHLGGNVSGFVGRHVVLGIRPEHLSPHPIAEAGPAVAIEADVNVIEPLGNDMDLFLKTTLHPHVVARVESQTGITPGTRVKMYVDLRKVHFFEPGVTGANLSLTTEQAHAVA
ncbi:MAG TPA: sn-glycerol-3-phosphate ABC transporter ATP-binding protein UgpC [Tepidisphaeraceae bacterium]|jgi:multiple sugar transport system ATP-binding protein